MATNIEYIDQKFDDFGGILVSEEHGTDLPEDAINENESENSDMKKQSEKVDVTVDDQDLKKYIFFTSNIFLIKMIQI